MSITLEPSVAETRPTEMLPENQTQQDAAHRLRGETTAVRLHIRWLGTRKSLSEAQRRQLAGTFEADIESLSAAKKLLDTSHPAFKAVTAIRNQATRYWKSQTLPYVEPGVRLLRRADVPQFDAQMREYREQLAAAVVELEDYYEELVRAARQALGSLFNSEDYPSELSGLFEIQWDYPSCAAPDYLRRVSPELYETECRRVRQRFDEAVRLAESAFAEELQGLVSHLAERLSGADDGQPKVFRDSAVTNLLEFFERFQRLNIRSDEQLDALVEDARGVIQGVDAQHLREDRPLAARVSEQLDRVTDSLDSWMSQRPRRSILRRSR